MSGASFASLAREASRRYACGDRFARHFAHGKLRGDPVFRFLLERGLVPRGARLLDLGCGQGVLAALFAAANQRHALGEWPETWPLPPESRAIRGIELRDRDVLRARVAAGDARFEQGDIRTADFGCADAIVLLDVLHYIGFDAQRDVLARARAALDAGGVLLLRVADADGSISLRYTLAIDRLAMALRGQWFGRFHCKPAAQWRSELEGLGFAVESHPMSRGTGFANVLLVARYDPLPR